MLYNVKTKDRCVNTRDDGIMLAEKAKEADALIIACYTPYSSVDALTKAFIERLYPLRHKHGFMAGKPGGAIVTCAVPATSKTLPPAGDMGVNAVMFYMMEEGMNFVLFAEHLWSAVAQAQPTFRQYAPIVWKAPTYQPGAATPTVDMGGKKVVIITDSSNEQTNLGKMLGGRHFLTGTCNAWWCRHEIVACVMGSRLDIEKHRFIKKTLQSPALFVSLSHERRKAVFYSSAS